jgi:hypothetical protein
MRSYADEPAWQPSIEPLTEFSLQLSDGYPTRAHSHHERRHASGLCLAHRSLETNRMTKPTASALANTQRTVQSYEGFARQYDALVNERRPPHIEDALSGATPISSSRSVRLCGAPTRRRHSWI